MSFGACTSSGGPVQQLRRRAGHRHDHPGRHLRSRMSAASAGGDRRAAEAAGARAARAARARRYRRARPRQRRRPLAETDAPHGEDHRRRRRRSRSPDGSMLLPVAARPRHRRSRTTATTRSSRSTAAAACAWSRSRACRSSPSPATRRSRDGMVVDTRGARGREGAPGRAGAAARQPSARLPDLRPGRRVLPAGLRVRATARREARTQEPRRKALKRVDDRSARRPRPGALHPLPPLRPLLPRRSPRRASSRVFNLGDQSVHRHVPGRAARQRLLDLHRRHLSGRRAAQQGLPPQDARVVPRRDRERLPELLERLQRQDRRRARARSSACCRGGTTP